MKVNFYNFSKRENSTKRPTGDGSVINCQVKESSNIDSPTLILTTGYINENYAYISAWSRYYFVTDITVETGGRIEVQLSCDVLATCKDYIANYTCFVERSASSYNDMFDDPYVSNSEDITYRAYAETHPGDGFSGSGCYLIRCVGGVSDTSGTGIQTYVTNEAGMLGFVQSLFDTTKYGFLSDEVVKSFFNPFQYVVEIKWMPVTFRSLVGEAGSEKTSNIICGWFDTGEIGYLLAADGVTATTQIALPNNPYSDFKRYSDRFSRYSLYLPGVGTIPISAADAVSGLGSTLRIDAITGIAQYSIWTADDYIGTYKTQMGVPIQIGQLNSSFLNMAGSMTSAAVSGISGNFLKMAGDLVDSVKSAFNPTASINGSNGDKYTFSNFDHIIVSLACRGTGERATSVAGRPCYATKRLGTLSGFVKCGNASIDIPFYENEKTSVNSFLNSGFYME